MRTLLVTFLGLLLSTASWSHGGHGSLGSGSVDGEVVELPILIGLDGSVSWALGGSHEEHAGESHGPEIMPILSVGGLRSDKRIQLEDGQVLRFRSRSYDIGIGGMASFGSLQLALLGGRGKMVSLQQKAPSLDASYELPLLTLPYNAEELRHWNVGDQMSFGTTGTVVFAAGVGVFQVGAAAQVSASGGWTISLSKTTETSVRVLLRRDRSRSIGLSAGALVLELGKNFSKDFDQEFSYEFDLAQEPARRAYLEALAGNWIAVPALWEKKTEGITRVLMCSGRKWSRSSQLRVGIPFVFRYGRASVHTDSEEAKEHFSEEENIVSTREDSIFSTFTKISSKVFLRRETVKDQFVFVGGVSTHQHEVELHRHPVGTFKWFFEKVRMPVKGVGNFLRKVSAQTGIDLREIPLPETYRGYARVSVDLMIKESGFKNIFKKSDQFLSRWPALLVLKRDYESKRDRSFAQGLKALGRRLVGNPEEFQAFLGALEGGHQLHAEIEGEYFAPVEWCLPKSSECEDH